MRASFQKDLTFQESYHLKGESAHHLLNVARVELDEEILLLNGNGLKIVTKVSSLSKRELELTALSQSVTEPQYIMDLVLGIPKKEALELSLKEAVELGFRRIFLVRSQYSQTRLPEPERIESLLISALEQSNSAFMPEIILSTWSEVPTNDYTEILMMDSQNQTQGRPSIVRGPRLLIVGPEGGFSPEELSLLHLWPKILVLNLPTPILRTPTAVAAGAGIIIGSLLD